MIRIDLVFAIYLGLVLLAIIVYIILARLKKKDIVKCYNTNCESHDFTSKNGCFYTIRDPRNCNDFVSKETYQRKRYEEYNKRN